MELLRTDYNFLDTETLSKFSTAIDEADYASLMLGLEDEEWNPPIQYYGVLFDRDGEYFVLIKKDNNYCLLYI